MKTPLKPLIDYFSKDIWNADRSSLSGARRFLLDALRFLVIMVRDIVYGQITLWATGLVYTTLMSLVPLLAVAFSVLKAFGVQNKLEPFLLDLFRPLGTGGPPIVHRIVEFVNNMRVGVLGAVGLGLLMWTVVSLVQKIEQAFNAIWKLRGQRSILHQFSDYLGIVLAGPVLIFSALALTATLMNSSVVQRLVQIQPFGTIIAVAGKMIPYVLVCASFTFLYIFLPNTKVRFSAGLIGGVIGGVLWQTAGWVFASFIVASTKYAAIYSSFAILILFMTWLYLSWLILLVGCEACFLYQNPQLLSLGAFRAGPDARFIERTAVSIMFLIGSSYYHGRQPWTESALLQQLGGNREQAGDVLAALKERALIIATAGDPPAYVPGRDPDTILLRDVYAAVRGRPEGRGATIGRIEAAEDVVRGVDEAIDNSLSTRSLKELIRSVNSKEREWRKAS